MKYDFSDNIQRGIIFLAKYSKDFYLQICSLVKPEYFEYPIHSNFYKAIKDYYEEYHSIPKDLHLLECIKSFKGVSEDLSDYDDEIHRINTMDASCIGHTDFFLDLIEKFAQRAAMKDAITNSIGLLKDDRIGEIETLVRDALSINRNVDLGHAYFSGVLERFERSLKDTKGNRFSLVFDTLNQELEGGLSAKELAMVVAPPGVGKSLYLVNQGVAALMQNKKVLYISLEMSEDKIAARFDSVMTLISQKNLKNSLGMLQKRLGLFNEKFPDSQLMIKEFPTGLANINDIRSLLVQLHNYEEFIPDVILVDYLELLRPTRDGLAEYQAQQRISEELRGLAVESNVLVWTATQTNRQGRAVKLITDSELADAYGKIRTCDYAISLNQSEEEFDDGQMRCYVMKSRNGKQRFVVPLSIDYSTLTMSESDPYESAE
jgi:archaellum biogenesis ATPase FlaH